MNKSQKKEIIKYLINKKISISIAESCTGGLLSKEITQFPNVSKIFNLGLVTYSNSMKTKLLKVSRYNLKKFGAVSEQVASEMCLGLLKLSNSNICISTTGIAGPSGGSKLKPIGTVYVGLLLKKNLNIYKLQLSPKLSREKIQKLTSNFVFNEIKKIFKIK